MEENIPTFTENDTLEERLKALEKQNKGLVGELVEKRRQVSSLEERLSQVETSLTSAADDNGEIKPEERVNRLAADPDSYISDIVTQAVEPLKRTISSMEADRQIERAKKWIAKREKIDPDDVDDKLGEELSRIGRDRGLVKLAPEEGIKASYEILLQERKAKEEEEARRSETINGNGTETVRSVPRSRSSRLSLDQIRQWIRDGKYEEHRAEILEAQAKGQIT